MYIYFILFIYLYILYYCVSKNIWKDLKVFVGLKWSILVHFAFLFKRNFSTCETLWFTALFSLLNPIFSRNIYSPSVFSRFHSPVYPKRLLYCGKNFSVLCRARSKQAYTTDTINKNNKNHVSGSDHSRESVSQAPGLDRALANLCYCLF